MRLQGALHAAMLVLDASVRAVACAVRVGAALDAGIEGTGWLVTRTVTVVDASHAFVIERARVSFT